MLACWALLACALGLLSAGSLYTESVTLAGLHRELAAAPPAARSLVVRTQILAERLQVADAAITPELVATLSITGGELTRALVSAPLADAATDPGSVTRLLSLASYEGLDRHAVLATGSWPVPGRNPVEVTVSETAARILGIGAGSTLSLVGRLDHQPVTVIVTGTWRADPGDAYWLGDPLLLEGSSTTGSFTSVGPLMADAADLTGGPVHGTLDAAWRAVPAITGFRPDNLDAVATSVDGLGARINAALPESNQATLTTKLPAIVAAVDRSVLVATSGILLLLVQFAVLGGYAVLLVASLLLERRRTETALLRARGAGFGHLLTMAAGEAMVVTVPAVLVAPWIAAGLVLLVARNPALAAIGLLEA
ncbi:MAG: FtsX-like permease family protein, partial [Chloroflexota bacterium]